MKRNCTSEASQFKTLNVTRPREYVVQVELNRPEKLNAMNTDFWRYMYTTVFPIYAHACVNDAQNAYYDTEDFSQCVIVAHTFYSCLPPRKKFYFTSC